MTQTALTVDCLHQLWIHLKLDRYTEDKILNHIRSMRHSHTQGVGLSACMCRFLL